MIDAMSTSFTPNRKVLYVDDEANLLTSFQSLMRRERVQVSVLQQSDQIEKVLLEQGPFAVVFSDQRMPGMDGVAVLETVSRIHPATIRILITGHADYADTVRAINQGGLSHFIAKPWRDDALRKLVAEVITRYNLAEENKFLLGELQNANTQLKDLLEGTLVGAIHILSDILTYLNPAAAAQVDRVRKLGLAYLNISPGISEQERWEIERALDLFNLGMALLPSWLQTSLNKGNAALHADSPILQKHHLVAAGLLKDIPRLEGVARIIALQAKNFDGSGEPANDPVQGKDIPLGARLLHILIDLDKAQVEKGQGRLALERMATQPAKYDVEIIARMVGAQSRPSQQTEQLLPLHDLRPGMILLDDIITENGQLLLKADFVLTDVALKILRQWHMNDPIVHKFRVKTTTY